MFHAWGSTLAYAVTQNLQSHILSLNALTRNLLPETLTAPLPMSINRASSVTVLIPDIIIRRLLGEFNGVDKIGISAELSKDPLGMGFVLQFKRAGGWEPQLPNIYAANSCSRPKTDISFSVPCTSLRLGQYTVSTLLF